MPDNGEGHVADMRRALSKQALSTPLRSTATSAGAMISASTAMNTRQMAECASAEADRQDQALTVAYHDAMARQSASGREHLRNAQRAWIKLRANTYTPEQGSGTMAAVEERICIAQENANRAADLRRH